MIELLHPILGFLFSTPETTASPTGGSTISVAELALAGSGLTVVGVIIAAMYTSRKESNNNNNNNNGQSSNTQTLMDISSRQGELRESLRQTNERLDTDLTDVKGDITDVKGDISTLATSVKTLADSFDEVKELLHHSINEEIARKTSDLKPSSMSEGSE